MLVKEWRKGNTVMVNGNPVTLTAKPKKAIDGTWIVFFTDINGKSSMQYVKDENNI